MAVSSIPVSLGLDREVIQVPLMQNTVPKETLLSQFPSAVGLKYFVPSIEWTKPGTWMAVLLVNERFQEPPGGWQINKTYIVVFPGIRQGSDPSSSQQSSTTSSMSHQSSSLTASANMILNNTQRLGEEVASCFKFNPRASSSYTRDTRGNRGRALARLNAKGKKPTASHRSLKVVFIYDVDLPCKCTKSLVVLESVTDISSQDTEIAIRTRLCDIVHNHPPTREITPGQLSFLNYSDKQLYPSVFAAGYELNGTRLRTHVGQGKLYVKINNFKQQEQFDSESDDDLPVMIHRRPRQEVSVQNSDPGSSTSVVTPSSTRSTYDSEASTTLDDSDVVVFKSAVSSNEPVPQGASTPHQEAATPVALSRPTCTSSNYQAYVELGDSGDVSDFEDEEADLNRAILKSLEDQQALQDHTYSNTLKDTLRQMQLSFCKEDHSRIIVHRRNVLASTLRAVTHSTFQFSNQLMVEFVGEEAVDFGGPARDFLRLLMKDISNKILVGPEDNKVFLYDIRFLENHLYKTCGKLISWSLMHGGPGLHCLNDAMVRLMMGQTVCPFNYRDIPEEDARARINQIIETKDATEYHDIIVDLASWLIDCGCTRYAAGKYVDKEKCVNSLCKFFLYYRIKPAIDGFVSGMDDVGHVWSTFISSVRGAKDMLCYTDGKLTVDHFKELYKVERSPNGSNQHSAELDTLYCWEVYLHECEDSAEINLNRLLEFITGAARAPPLGFQKQITIGFFSPSQEERQCNVRRLPSASTCGLQLNLPRGISDAEEFKLLMDRAVLECCGFGRL